MANEQYAFIHKKNVPTLAQWQDAVMKSGFDLRIDPHLQVFEHSGFLPCKLMSEDSGVETYYQEAKAIFDNPDAAAELAGDRDYCISFSWGGSLKEAACAMILSYSLASSFGAVISYEGEPPYEELDALRRDTESILNDAKKEKRRA